MGKNNVVSILSIMLLVFSCKGQDTKQDGLGSFDIASNDKQIVFSYSKNNVTSLYVSNIDGKNVNLLIGSSDGISYFNPKYSPDSKKIIFIANKKGSINSTLCIANSNGSDIINLTDDSQIITEAAFSNSGESIYFCKADEYAKYSPIGVKDFHGIDIYSLSIVDKKVAKLSNLNSYELGNIAEVDSNHLLFRLESGSESGIYLYTKDNSTLPQIIIPINNPRKDATFYYSPIYSDSLKLMAFTAPYELYVMDLKNKIANLVSSHVGKCDFGNIAFFKTQKKIMFSYVCSPDLFSINADGTELKTIPLIIK
jgi:Tol biopolymer transport system component